MLVRVVALLAAVCLSLPAQTSRVFIETVAGAATFDNRAPRQTPLVQPQAVWVAPNGDLYISDGNFVVRRVRNNVTTIVAGSGLVVDDSIPIPAKSAKLDYPNGIVGTATGELYISDVNHNRIQRLNADGTIVTIVGKGTAGYSGDGGRGTFAELWSPSALALSSAGDLFIADKDNAVVRKYNIISGIITTYAGTGEVGYSGDGKPAVLAKLGTIQSLAVDARGNLYLDDTQYDEHDNVSEVRIRRVSPDGIITTYAGAGPVGTTGDGGSALKAKLQSSQGLAVDAQGNLYIADADTVRVVGTDGIIRPYAGQTKTVNSGIENVPATQAYLNTPGAIAFDADGNLFIPESTGELVRRIDAKTKLITTVVGTSNPFDGTPAASAPINHPTGLASDKQGNLYVVDSGHFRVRRIDGLTGRISTVAGDGHAVADVNSTDASLSGRLVISVDDAKNRLLITDQGDDNYYGAVYAVDLQTGKLTTLVDFSEYNSPYNYAEPTGVVGDAAGNVYISDWYNDLVYKYSPNGDLNVFAGKLHDEVADTGDGGAATDADLNGPRGLLIDRQGGVLICDTDNHRVRRVNPSTGIIRPFAGDGLNNSDFDGHRAVTASLKRPVALALDSDGWVYISDRGAHQVRVVTTDLLIYTAGGGNGRGFSGDGGPGLLSQFDTPLGVAAIGIDVYVSDSFNYRIRRLFYKDINNDPVVDPQRLSFRATKGGPKPSLQLLTVNSSYVGLNIDYTVDDSAGDWLVACTATQGTDCAHGSTPDLVGVNVLPNGLAVGKYTANLIIRAEGSPDLSIPIDLTIDPPNVVTSVTLSPGVLRFRAPQNSSSVQRLEVNSGGGALPWSIQRQNDAPWLTFSATSGTTPATVDVTVDSKDLRPGTYSALSYFNVADGSPRLLIATLTVTDAKATLQLDRDSMLFEAVEGTTSAPPQPVRIYNTGGAPLSWQLLFPSVDDQSRSVNWIRASSAGDTVQPGGDPSVVNIAVNPAGLREGVYSVPLVISAQGANGAPQVLGARLRILPAGAPAKAVFDKTALVFIGAPGATLDPQTIDLASTGGSLTYSSAAHTDGGGLWLTATPANGVIVSSAQGATMKVQVTAPADTGVYTGDIKFSFSDGSVREVKITTIVRAGSGSSASAGKGRSASCEATKQVLIVPTLTNNFALNVGWPVPVQAQVYDNCGAPSTLSAVSVSFDNGDPVLVLKNLSAGRYSGTWTPNGSGSTASTGAVAVSMLALRPGLEKGEWATTGRLSRQASTPPILAAGGVLNAASRLNTALLAPGGRIALQGANFPESPEEANVLIGGSVAKVVSSSPEEIQVVAPAPLDGVTQTYVIVNARGFSTSPQTVSVVPTDPGLFPLPDGTSASVGASIIIQATGLGAVDAGGNTTAKVTAKIGSLDATVTSATLPPNADGVYQLKIVIPDGASGAMPITVSQNGASSNPVTINIQ